MRASESTRTQAPRAAHVLQNTNLCRQQSLFQSDEYYRQVDPCIYKFSPFSTSVLSSHHVTNINKGVLFTEYGTKYEYQSALVTEHDPLGKGLLKA